MIPYWWFAEAEPVVRCPRVRANKRSIINYDSKSKNSVNRNISDHQNELGKRISVHTVLPLNWIYAMNLKALHFWRTFSQIAIGGTPREFHEQFNIIRQYTSIRPSHSISGSDALCGPVCGLLCSVFRLWTPNSRLQSTWYVRNWTRDCDLS